jgi:hypothetical protein
VFEWEDRSGDNDEAFNEEQGREKSKGARNRAPSSNTPFNPVLAKPGNHHPGKTNNDLPYGAASALPLEHSFFISIKFL